MRIMWISALHLPAVSEHLNEKPAVTGGWILSMIEELLRVPGIDEIAVATPCNVSKVEKIISGKIIYYLIPGKNSVFRYSKRAVNYINQVAREFRPDLIDMQGIEFFIARSFVEADVDCPKVATLQGLASSIYRFYLAGIPAGDIITSRTIKDNLLLDGLLERKYKMKKRGDNERFVINNLNYVIGRTRWDYSIVKSINPHINYYHCDRNLREDFYLSETWDINKIQRYSIVMSQAESPIKGLHFLLEAVYYLKRKYPDIRLFVGGRNMLKESTLKEKIFIGGYRKYLRKIVCDYGLENNVIFLGSLNAIEMAKRMVNSHVYVLPSVIENSPNSLAEAQILGVPSIAALVGGVADYVEEGKSGLLYNLFEPAVLANRIDEIFSNDELSSKLSEYGRMAALQRHERKKNTLSLIEAYKEIIEDFRRKQ